MLLDTKSEFILNELYPPFALKLRLLIQAMKDKHNLSMRLTSGVRSFQAQGELYAQGRSKPGKIVTNAKPGMSLHNYGLAADLCFKGNDPFLEQLSKTERVAAGMYHRAWMLLAVEADLLGLNPGIKWKDAPHVEWYYIVSKLYDLKVHDIMPMEEIWAYLDAQIPSKIAAARANPIT